MKYWQRRGKIMKLLSYLAMGGSVYMILSGQAFFSIILLMFSFRLSTESEMCALRGMLLNLHLHQEVLTNQLIGVEVEELKEDTKS